MKVGGRFFRISLNPGPSHRSQSLTFRDHLADFDEDLIEMGIVIISTFDWLEDPDVVSTSDWAGRLPIKVD